jgi:hypothetical protein
VTSGSTEAALYRKTLCLRSTAPQRHQISISFAHGLASQTFLLRMAELFHVTRMRRHQAVCLLPIRMNGLGSLLEFSLQPAELPAELREVPLQPRHFAPDCG